MSITLFYTPDTIFKKKAMFLGRLLPGGIATSWVGTAKCLGQTCIALQF